MNIYIYIYIYILSHFEDVEYSRRCCLAYNIFHTTIYVQLQFITNVFTVKLFFIKIIITRHQ